MINTVGTLSPSTARTKQAHYRFYFARKTMFIVNVVVPSICVAIALGQRCAASGDKYEYPPANDVNDAIGISSQVCIHVGNVLC